MNADTLTTPRPGRAYWLTTTLAAPVTAIGLLLLIALGRPDTATAAVIASIAVLVAATTFVERMPRLRAMAPGRRLGYCVLSAVLQVAVSAGLLFVVVVAWISIACQAGCLD